MGRKGFLNETKVSMSFIWVRRISLWFPIMKINETIIRTNVYPIDRWTLILTKMVERKAFLIKPKHHCHLFQWEECVYSAKSWKERGLLLVSIFVPIDERTLISKNGEKKLFLWKQRINVIYLDEENVFMMPNQEKK